MKSIVLGIASAAVLTTGLTISQRPAQASWSDATNFLNNNWGAIVSNLWSPWNKQVFMTNLSPQETRDVQNQYRSRADGVLFDRCVNKVADTYYTGWRNGAIKTAYRWTISMRVENGQANCYQRMTNNNADDFMRRRGW
ncbi:hypothetical protein B6N60_04905 [Richelia sinica FACHB-800]|uniref:Uncharacterized protein n=2 Tax=Richelia TaxID=98443 RepID=A0A975Y7C4_9NOST|nr:hypothetical protein B6N60_04905 [Richelia sinica FACHB-800]